MPNDSVCNGDGSHFPNYGVPREYGVHFTRSSADSTKNSDLVEAQKKELAILTQAIADLKELTASIKIELARATGEKRSSKQR